jgi:hypothetical protein
MDIFVTYASDKGHTDFPVKFKSLIFRTKTNTVDLDMLADEQFIRKHTGWEEWGAYSPCLISWSVMGSMYDMWSVKSSMPVIDIE